MAKDSQTPRPLPRSFSGEAARALAALLLDELLATPLEQTLPPAFLARQLVEGLAGADPEHLRARLGEALARHREALGRLSDPKAPLRSLLPEAAAAPLAELAAASQMPRRETLESLLDHPAMRDILRAVLLDTLTRFTSKVGSLASEASRLPGGGRLSGVLGVAKGVGSALMDEVSRKLEGRTGPFVDEALSRAVQVGLDAMTDPGREKALKEWRRSAVGAVLDLPASVLEAESERVDLDALSRNLIELLQAFAAWEPAVRRLTELLQISGGELWSLPLGEALEQQGLRPESWRPRLEAHLGERLGVFLGGEGFAAWAEAHGEDPDAGA